MGPDAERRSERLVMANGLNPEQQAAVDTLSGPMLVLAGAGSGKTRVVTFRVANLIRHGTVPSRILAVTFTNKAAAEMHERLTHQLGKRKDRPQICTFHAHCVRVLRRHIRKLGYPEQFAIYDRGDQESIARSVLREIKVPGELLRPGDLLFQISQWKSHSIRPHDAAQVARTDKEHLCAMAYRRYQRTLKNSGAVDFDDLLLLTEDLFRDHADVRREEQQRFDHLLVDEYQDTNGSQYRIIRSLAGEHRNLCVVGDDDQSIYGWRGAEVEHILRFKHDWPDAKVIRLEWNYRSTAAILETANRLIAYNKKRHDKVIRAARPGGDKPRIEQYPGEVEEAQGVVADIQRRMKMNGLEPKDFAILFRTNEQPRPFEQELRKAKLPYVILGSQSFFDRKEVKDLLCYLRVVHEPNDEVSLLRIINTPPRGIGDRTVELLMAEAVRLGKPLWHVLHQLPPGPATFTDNKGKKTTLNATSVDSVRRFVAIIERYHAEAKQTRNLTEMARRLITDVQYEAEVRRQYPQPEEQQARLNAVEEFVNALANYVQQNEEPTLAGFMDEIALGERDMGNDKDKQLARNAIALLTLHSAKGLEFPHVYMVGMEEGILPHHRSVKAEGSDQVDEERRLCYVGITRAQERLTLSLPLSRMKWGKPRETQPSRFLFEIMGQADNPHHRGGAGPHRPHAAGASASQGPPRPGR